MTLTDRRVIASFAKLYKEMEALYFRAFGPEISPSDQFHGECLKLDIKLTLKLQQRPISQLEIDVACKAAYTAFNAACKAERERLGLKEVFKPPPPPMKLEPVEFGPWRRPTS